MKKLSYYCVLAVGAMGLAVACGKAKDDSTASVRGAGNSNAKPAASSVFSYSFDSVLTQDGKTIKCTTKKHEFKTEADMCIALKNEKLNNNCALDQRTQMFNEKCLTQTPTSGFDKKDIGPTDKLTETIKTEAKKDDQQPTSLADIRCLKAVEELATQKIDSGISLLGKSQGLVVRDDSTEAGKQKPVLVLACKEAAENIADQIKNLDLEKISKNDLSQETGVKESVVLATVEQQKKSAMLNVFCTKDVVKASVDLASGLILNPGAAVLLVRDLEMKDSEGKTGKEKNLKEISLITCAGGE